MPIHDKFLKFIRCISDKNTDKVEELIKENRSIVNAKGWQDNNTMSMISPNPLIHEMSSNSSGGIDPLIVVAGVAAVGVGTAVAVLAWRRYVSQRAEDYRQGLGPEAVALKTSPQ